MARQLDTFATAGSGPGSDFFVSIGSSSNVRRISGYLDFTSTSEVGLRANTRAISSSQYSQFSYTANVGTNIGPTVGGYIASSFYKLAHSGTQLTLLRYDGGSVSTLATFSHTRAAGQVVRLEMVRSGPTAALVGKINGTQVISASDPVALPGYYVGIHNIGTTGVQVDNFDAGDIGDMTAGTNPAVREDMPLPPNLFRGLVDVPGRGLRCPGEVVQDQQLYFLGAQAAWTPPAWLTVTGSDASPAFNMVPNSSELGRLRLFTGAAIDNYVELATTQSLSTTEFTAFRLDFVGLSWSNLSPLMEMQVFADDRAGSPAGGGFGIAASEEQIRLYSNGGLANGNYVQDGIPFGDGTRRRARTLWAVTATKELYLVEGENILGYRDCTGTWTDGQIKMGIRFVSKQAAGIDARFSSLRFRAYA